MEKNQIEELAEKVGRGNFPYLDNKLNENKRVSLAVRKYIDIIKKHKELHLFIHHLWLVPHTCISNEIFLLFNEEGAKLVTGIGYEIEKDDEIYHDYIDKTISFIELEI